jgi:hypothetical protein
MLDKSGLLQCRKIQISNAKKHLVKKIYNVFLAWKLKYCLPIC